MIAKDKARHGGRMPVDISIKEQSWVSLLKKLGNLRLLLRILVEIYQYLRGSNGRSA